VFLSCRYIDDLHRVPMFCASRGGSVSVLTRLQIERLGSIRGRGWDFFSSTPRPDRYWGPPNHLSNG